MRAHRISAIAEFAAVVRGRRKELGLSQAEAAARAGVSRPWLSEFERGKPKAELHLALRLLEALDLETTLQPRDADAANAEGTANPPDLFAVLDSYLKK